MVPLEFTTTACNRPEILHRTYRSFTNGLQGVDWKQSTLYINIDPAPNNTRIDLVEKVARQYFGTVITNYPEEANFAKAVIWCFSQPKNKFFFHLEDDWLLNVKVDVPKMIKMAETDPSIHQMVFEQRVIEHPNEPTFVPSLHRTEHTKLFLPHMSPNLNPEAQVKKLYKMWNSQNKVRFKYPIVGRNIVTDIGRTWLKNKGLRRDYERTRQFSGKGHPKGWTPWISWDTTFYRGS